MKTHSKVDTLTLSPELQAYLVKGVSSLKNKETLIIGDVGVDEYILGEVKRISPEAPVPVLEVEKEDVRLGLAANVAQNVTALGGRAHLISVVGRDQGADTLKSLLSDVNVSFNHMVIDNNRPTTRKARVMAQHHHLVRIDFETRKNIEAQFELEILKKVEELAPQVDNIVIEDYAKGVVTQKLVQGIVQIAKRQNKKVLVDPHRSQSLDIYQGVDVIKPNFDEAVALSGLTYDSLRDKSDKVFEVGEAVLKKMGRAELVMTRGKEGMTVFSNGKISQVPTFARDVFDVTGAGDTVIATLALGLASGLSLVESCMLANFAAGVVVAQVGCVPCKASELVDYIQQF